MPALTQQAVEKMQLVKFTLVLSGISKDTPDLEDKLFEAGFDDALLNFTNRTVSLDFCRENCDPEATIVDAITRIEKIAIGAIVDSVTPSPYLTLADIAARTNLSKQHLSLLATGERGDGSFPKPIFKVDNKSPLWRWRVVLQWMLLNGKLKDPLALAHAELIEDINAALDSRAADVNEHRQRLRDKLIAN